MFNNYSSLFTNYSLKEFIEEYSLIRDEIIIKNNFNFKIGEKDINIFFQIIKHYGFEIFYNLNYITKSNNLNYLISNTDIKEIHFKNFFMKQIILLFIFLYYIHKKRQGFNNDNDNNKLEKELFNIYNNLFVIILHYYSSSSSKNNNNSILDIDNISEIFHFNIILSLTDLLSKNDFFNLSINYLIKFFTDNNNNIKDLKSFYILFEQLYQNLLMNHKNLNFLKRDKNIQNFIIFKITNITTCTACDSKLKSIILEILELIYKRNYSNKLSNIILNNVKESFYELKENYDKNEIIKYVKYLDGQTEFINYLFNIEEKEEKEEKDEYMPSTYFEFDGSIDSGINYNPNGELIKKSFTLVFAFKINEITNEKLYPLITFVSENQKKEIIFNLSIYNSKLYLVSQGDKNMNLIDDISSKKSYLVVIEFYKSLLKDKIKVSLNGNKKEINTCDINYKLKSSLKIGYIPNEVIIQNTIFNSLIKNINHFNGIVGPVIFFNNILDEKDFISNITKLKGRYDSILFLNSDINIVYYYYYEENEFYYDKEFKEAQEYFLKLSKKINEECLFTICPLSIINSTNRKTNFFIEDIYTKNNKDKINNKELFHNFNILQIYSSKTTPTYAKCYSRSISVFVQYDGIYIYILIIEYFYNLLRMLINEPKEEIIEIVNEINNVLYQIITSITKIIMFFNIDSFSNDLDTFGFSLKKLFGLLIDYQPLSTKLVEVLIISISQFLEKKEDKKTSYIIKNFGFKLFTLICYSDYYDMSIYRNVRGVFRFFELIIKNNEQLINNEVMNGLLSFSFVLNTYTLDKYNNKPNGYTFKKNIDYKQMKKQYKNLIICFIKQCDDFQMYIKFIEKVCTKNISLLEKYMLIKIYYKNNDVLNIYNKFMTKKKISESSKSIFDIFKKEKEENNFINNEEDLLNEYIKNLSKIIKISSFIDPKDEKPYELLKSVFILLIYEHYKIVQNSNKNEINISNKSIKSINNFVEEILFFNNKRLYFIRDNKMNNKFSLSRNSSILNLSPLSSKEEENKNIENDDDNELILDFSSEDDNQSLDRNELLKNSISIKNINSNSNINEKCVFDFLLTSMNYSFYIIKAIFACINDQWDKKTKLKFINNNNELYEEFDMCFGEFNLYKKKLFIQFIILIECLNDENTLEKSLRLIFSFMKQNISDYKVNKKNKIKYSKSILLHLFESKSIVNNYFEFSLNNEIITKSTFKNYILSSIKEINNEILIYHPRPYIFSFIKKIIKEQNSQIVQIIKNVCDFIIENIKKVKSNASINNYFYFNVIRFIKTLTNIFEKNPTESQNLLTNNNYVLFITIQNLISVLFKNEIIYDNHIYSYNPFCFIESNKSSEKKESKILQSQETTVLSNKIIFINVF